MKFLLLFVLSILSNGVIAQLKESPQSSQTPDRKAKERKEIRSTPTEASKLKAKKLKSSLQLTDQQETSIYNVYLKYDKDVSKVRKSKLSNKDKFAKMNSLNQEKQKQMERILTKEQYNDYILSFP